MKIAILGAGLIGKKRGLQVGAHELAGLYDPNKDRAAKLASELGTKFFSSEEDLLKNSGADIVLIATTNNTLAGLAKKCLEHGKHVLVEKPGAIRLGDLEELRALSKKTGKAVKVGFNHRFHPAIFRAKELIDHGALGELMFLRARYGHGGRVGYEKEWRAIPEIGGGGELLDQGVHVLDLIHWYFDKSSPGYKGPLELSSSLVTTSFWDMPVDDNAVLTLTNGKQWATFHVSCSEWKNLFTLEVYGRTGKVLIEGLGGSYGKETLTYYKMLPEMGPPVTEKQEFDATDHSWARDLENLIAHIQSSAPFITPLLGDLDSAIYAMKQVRKAYQDNGYNKLPCSV